LSFPSPGDTPHPGIKPRSPALQADSLPSEPPEKPYIYVYVYVYVYMYVHSEGDQPWDFFGRNDAKAETPVLWPPHAKS